jgi:branched-chain amino acid transport system permease protein
MSDTLPVEGSGLGTASPKPASHSSSSALADRSQRWTRFLRLPGQPLVRHVILAIAGAIVLLLISHFISSYDNLELAEVGWYAIAIAGLTLLTGVSGQISLGQGAFMAVGAYATGLMLEHTHLPLIVPILVGVAAAGLVGVVIGLPATRLRGPYLAGVTLALVLAFQDLPAKFSSVFNGDQGIPVNPVTPPPGVNSDQWLAWITLLAALVTMVLFANLLKSRFGRSLAAVRDDEIAAQASGLHPARLRVLAFGLASASAGLAGAFAALWTGIVSPNSFSLLLSIQLLAGMVIGGSGSLLGAWWGALALVYIPEWSNSLSGDFNISGNLSANLQNIIFGVLLIGIMMLAPTGIQGWLRAAWRALSRRLTARRRRPLLSSPPVTTTPTQERTTT